MIPLGTGKGRVRKMPSGKFEITVDAETPLDEWLEGLPDADQGRHGVSARVRAELGLLSLVAIVFFNVSGGPYGSRTPSAPSAPGSPGPPARHAAGLEPARLARDGELASALPEEGGYVESGCSRAFGRFWGFQVGWWSWINSFVDVAVYPALFADYVEVLAAGHVPARPLGPGAGLHLDPHRHQPRRACASRAGSRWRSAALALAPVVVFTAIAGTQLRDVPWRPFAAEERSLLDRARPGARRS